LEIRPPWLKELWDSFLASVPRFLQTIAYRQGRDVPGWAAFVVSAITAISFLIRNLRAIGLKPEEILAFNTGDGENRKPYHLRFAEQFHDVAAALALRRMVILVDDLDRCRPQYVLDTLEAINFLVSSGECFVVMGTSDDNHSL
jgi:hypothetical protein